MGLKQKKSNRPTRGLIFGPTRGESRLSESGKRLRVERVDLGRAGGIFVNDSSMGNHEIPPLSPPEGDMEEIPLILEVAQTNSNVIRNEDPSGKVVDQRGA